VIASDVLDVTRVVPPNQPRITPVVGTGDDSGEAIDSDEARVVLASNVSLKVSVDVRAVEPADFRHFAFSAAGECHALRKVGAVPRVTAASRFHCADKLRELYATRQRERPLPIGLRFNVAAGFE
jgi:hypothetical protein